LTNIWFIKAVASATAFLLLLRRKNILNLFDLGIAFFEKV